MRVFISYSHADEAVLRRLHTHLAMLQREGSISEWHDRAILAGDKIDQVIDDELGRADIFLPLVSPDFLASHYCYDREMLQAIEQQEKRRTRIVPVIVEQCDWLNSPLKIYKAVPRDGKPIAEWTNQNNALYDVVSELRKIIDAQRSTAGTMVVAPEEKTGSHRKYKVKRDFDEVEIAGFIDESYEEVKLYFQSALKEISSVEGVKTRFADRGGGDGFTCSLFNKGLSRGAAHLTVYLRGTRRQGAGIFYSYEPENDRTSYNGVFNVENDEYNLFFQRSSFHADEVGPLTAKAVAEVLWGELLERAGISYA